MIRKTEAASKLGAKNQESFAFRRESFNEFDSVINLRPAQGNRSRDVLDPQVRQKIILIVKKLVEDS